MTDSNQDITPPGSEAPLDEYDHEAAEANAFVESVKWEQIETVKKCASCKEILDGQSRSDILGPKTRTEFVNIDEKVRKAGFPESLPHEFKHAIYRFRANYRSRKRDNKRELNQLAEMYMERISKDPEFKAQWEEIPVAKFLQKITLLSEGYIYKVLDERFKNQDLIAAMKKYYEYMKKRKMVENEGSASGADGDGEPWPQKQMLEAHPAAGAADTCTLDAENFQADQQAPRRTPQPTESTQTKPPTGEPTPRGEEKTEVWIGSTALKALNRTLPPNLGEEEKQRFYGRKLIEGMQAATRNGAQRLKVIVPAGIDFPTNPTEVSLYILTALSHESTQPPTPSQTNSLDEASKNVKLNEYTFQLLEKYRKEKNLPTLQDALENIVIGCLTDHMGYKI
jgi:hypothetical protein